MKLYGRKLNEDANPLWDRFSIDAVTSLIAFDGSKQDNNKIIARQDSKLGVGLRETDLDSLIQQTPVGSV